MGARRKVLSCNMSNQKPATVGGMFSVALGAGKLHTHLCTNKCENNKSPRLEIAIDCNAALKACLAAMTKVSWGKAPLPPTLRRSRPSCR